MKRVIVTTSWDDGHKLDLKVSGLLTKYKIKGTFYIAPLNRQWSENDLLTGTQIKYLSRDFEIGAHTMTHPFLTEINKSRAKKEIRDSKDYFEKLLDRKIVSFCYPDGRHNKKVQKLVRQAGLKYARTTERHTYTFPKNLYASGTTLHALKQFQDVFKIAQFSSWNPIFFLKNINWANLGKAMFDYVEKRGGVYHLFGHSWIIEAWKEWDKLENLLSHISDRPGVLYLENKDLVGFSEK